MPKKLGFHTLGIQPAVLRWARESQGYSLDDVALHLKRDIDEIIAWESGTASPTYAQLESLAYGLYKRPLAVFFLPAPPTERNVKQEFRTLPDIELDQLAADTRYQIRLAHAYQISLRELNEGVNPSPRKIFGKYANRQGKIPDAAQRVRKYLGISIEAQADWKDCEKRSKRGAMRWRHRTIRLQAFLQAEEYFRLLPGRRRVSDHLPEQQHCQDPSNLQPLP